MSTSYIDSWYRESTLGYLDTMISTRLTYVTPKGAPHLAKCHAKATRERAASKLTDPAPQEKLM